MTEARPGQGPSLLVRGRLKVSELLPLVSRRRAPLSSAFLGPVLLTLAVVVVLINGSYASNDDVLFVIRTVMVWLAAVGLYFIHVLCGRVRSAWWTAGAFAIAVALTATERALGFPFLHAIEGLAPNFEGRFLQQLSHTAVPEELLKGLPILASAVLGARLHGSWGRRLGIRTPLEGALLGAAVGAGFTFIETDQYVFAAIHPEADLSPDQVARILAANPNALVPNQTVAFAQLLLRMLGQVSMHAAWTGVTGYYVGLAALLPRRAGPLALMALAMSAVLHAGWNSTSSGLATWIVGGVSYAVFASAVLKGQHLAGVASPTTKPVPTVQPVVAEVVPVRSPPSQTPEPPARSILVRVGTELVRLRPGDTIRTTLVPELQPSRGDAVVGEVVENPSDPTVWGLRNLSRSVWTAVVGPGDERQLEPGYTVRLDEGLRVRLGGIELQVEAVRSDADGRPLDRGPA